MAAPEELDRHGGASHARQRGDSIAVPDCDLDEEGSATVFAARTAEALKRAAREGVGERWEHIEAGNTYGCVDWFLYPETERPHAGH